ncbi:YafY family transcriptional regulator [Paenibacillus albicereus]|uniref:YafY family transcriptional regulator n=1 Tax=Paenibacillus albicereus TaxID=2726185 RepID=A0A6H2GZ50_9BACL|nr:YafY family protein [Paenibacillus albicereus]QJC52672.1 YafY family transcriptional regulator [Paenibacillus albicereus]
MNKAQRLVELMMTVNRRRKFTAGELAQQFGVSKRTILRDLQELGEIGVPLYSEAGPHGGYQVVRERMLPAIAFTLEEATALFFASHALRHYASLPFEEAAASALGKFYLCLPGEVRERIDRMKDRFDLVIPERLAEAPLLPRLLEAAVGQETLLITYTSEERGTERLIQPVGIYADRGFWYCPAYCFLRGGYRLFRCDRILSAEAAERPDDAAELRDVHLGNWEARRRTPKASLLVEARLSEQGVIRCQAERHLAPLIRRSPDGGGQLQGHVAASELDYMAGLLAGLGLDASVQGPPELIGLVRRRLTDWLDHYGGIEKGAEDPA